MRLTEEQRQALFNLSESKDWPVINTLLEECAQDTLNSLAAIPKDHRYYQGVYAGIRFIMNSIAIHTRIPHATPPQIDAVTPDPPRRRQAGGGL
jgi:hypothetical protein